MVQMATVRETTAVREEMAAVAAALVAAAAAATMVAAATAVLARQHQWLPTIWSKSAAFWASPALPHQQ